MKMSRTEIWDGQLQTFDKKNNIMVAVCTLQSMDAPVSLYGLLLFVLMFGRPSALYVKKYHTHQSISPNMYVLQDNVNLSVMLNRVLRWNVPQAV